MIIGSAKIKKSGSFLIVEFRIFGHDKFVLGFLFLLHQSVLFKDGFLIMFIDILLILETITNAVIFFVFKLDFIKC